MSKDNRRTGNKQRVTLYVASLSLLLVILMALPRNAAAQSVSFNEAPQLAEQVRDGQLPPVEERLPNQPRVIEPLERIGQYGGAWRFASVRSVAPFQLLRAVGYENLVAWNPEWTGVVPNVAESFEVNENATAFTFKLREGLKWSDGHPFTADDILFWYEAVSLNEILTPVRSDNAPAVETLDDFTVVFSFAEPNSFFLDILAGPGGTYATGYPRHYLEQFHIDYNPEANELAEQNDFDSWEQLFWNKLDVWNNPERPRLHAWVLAQAIGDVTQQVTAQRNPYYFKVDSEGNQLPYLDRFVLEMIDNPEVMLLKTLNGELDYVYAGANTLRNRAVLFDYQEQGEYHFVEAVDSYMNSMVISLNLTHKNPVKREIFSNKDFRIGLSHAMNRQEIIDLVFLEQGEPHQAAPRPESEFYNERLAKQYTEYDVEKANEHLDRAGYSERDGQGFRLGPDGNRIAFAVEVNVAIQEHIDALELIQGYWREVGVDMQIRAMERSLFYTRMSANEHDAGVWEGTGGLADAFLDLRYYMPFHAAESLFAIPWAIWRNNPQAPLAEEPPAEVQRQLELYDELLGTVDEEGQAELKRQILEIAADQFYAIGMSLPSRGYAVVRNDFHNVPAESFAGWFFLNPGPLNPSQFFRDNAP